MTNNLRVLRAIKNISQEELAKQQAKQNIKELKQ